MNLSIIVNWVWVLLQPPVQKTLIPTNNCTPLPRSLETSIARLPPVRFAHPALARVEVLGHHVEDAAVSRALLGLARTVDLLLATNLRRDEGHGYRVRVRASVRAKVVVIG